MSRGKASVHAYAPRVWILSDSFPLAKEKKINEFEKSESQDFFLAPLSETRLAWNLGSGENVTAQEAKQAPEEIIVNRLRRGYFPVLYSLG